MQEPQDLLADIEHEMVFTPASTGLRFANYLIDVMVFYMLIFLFGILAGTLFNPDKPLTLYFITFLIFFGYYTLMEGATGGKTLGKLVTGTRAIKANGSSFGFGDAALRSLCRFVPFEPLSTLAGAPWHDKWAGTLVVKG